MQIKLLAASTISPLVRLLEISASFLVIELNALQPHLKDVVCIATNLSEIQKLTIATGSLSENKPFSKVYCNLAQHSYIWQAVVPTTIFLERLERTLRNVLR